MELTDPRYVWLTTDTSHLTLGGMDPLQIMKDYWPRVAEVHYKDAPTHLRGTKSWRCPSRARNRAAITGSATWAGRIRAAWTSCHPEVPDRAELSGLGDVGSRRLNDTGRSTNGRDHQGQPQISG